MAGYRGGHILKIKVKNFMTYEEMELIPQHGLNLILGLNGSGKSTIMCAICLGLGGKPSFTGRSVQLSDFIKYGCKKATIEIELDNPVGRNKVITRILEGDKSTWLLNKSASTLTEIQNTVNEYNIDVGNLCQFLPQEKVAEFSKMDKKQRLENMLQAIGEPQLFLLFKELKQKKTESLKLEEEIRRCTSQKDAELQKNQRLKIEVDKQEEKVRIQETLKSLFEQKKIMDYREIKESSDKMKEEKKQFQKLSQELQKQLAEKGVELTQKSRSMIDIVEVLKKSKQALNDLQAEITEKESKLPELNENAQNAKINFQNRMEEKRNQKAKLSDLESQIEALEKLHTQNLIEQPDLERRNQIVQQNLETIKTDLNSITSSLAYSNLEKNKLEYSIRESHMEMEKMKNEINKRLEFLKHRFKDVYEAYMWLEENKDKFRATIYPPMLLLLKIANDQDRKYIENTIAVRDLVAFLCEDKEDNILFTQIVRQNKKLNVNVVMVPDNPIQYYSSPHISSDLRSSGVKCYLKDIIEAPESVMRFLCHCYHLHIIPLCDSFAEKNMNHILLRYKVFFLPDAKISKKQSKYGDRNTIIRRDAIQDRNFLPSSKDYSDQFEMLHAKAQAEKNQMIQLQNVIAEFDAKIGELERKENTLRNEKKSISEKLNDIKNTERHLHLKKKSYNMKKNELIDETQERIKVKSLMQRINLNKKEICLEICRDLERFVQAKSNKLKDNIKAKVTLKKLTEIRTCVKEKEANLRQYQLEIATLIEKLKKLRDEGLKLYSEINKSMFLQEGLHRTKEEVDRDICRYQAQLELNNEDGSEILNEYKSRQRRIGEVEDEINAIQARLDKLKAEMAMKKGKWLPALQKHIQNINSKFSQYYRQLHCAGEISLDTCNNTDEFQKYGLQIILKYRDSEPFMELSNTHHSGGECSVAAIIFILSLQELTEVPFRCIDEINQGMDSHNERKIYDLIADSAKGGSCSQYFLLTPKLLMELEMIEHQDVAVHVIYNSCFLDMRMDVENHLEFLERSQ